MLRMRWVGHCVVDALGLVHTRDITMITLIVDITIIIRLSCAEWHELQVTGTRTFIGQNTMNEYMQL